MKRITIAIFLVAMLALPAVAQASGYQMPSGTVRRARQSMVAQGITNYVCGWNPYRAYHHEADCLYRDPQTGIKVYEMQTRPTYCAFRTVFEYARSGVVFYRHTFRNAYC